MPDFWLRSVGHYGRHYVCWFFFLLFFFTFTILWSICKILSKLVGVMNSEFSRLHRSAGQHWDLIWLRAREGPTGVSPSLYPSYSVGQYWSSEFR